MRVRGYSIHLFVANIKDRHICIYRYVSKCAYTHTGTRREAQEQTEKDINILKEEVLGGISIERIEMEWEFGETRGEKRDRWGNERDEPTELQQIGTKS